MATTGASGMTGTAAGQRPEQAAKAITDQIVRAPPSPRGIVVDIGFATAYFFNDSSTNNRDTLQVDTLQSDGNGFPAILEHMTTIAATMSFQGRHFARSYQYQGLTPEMVNCIALYLFDAEAGRYITAFYVRTQEQLNLAIALISAIYHQPSLCPLRLQGRRCELCEKPAKLVIAIDRPQWNVGLESKDLPVQATTFTFMDGANAQYGTRLRQLSEVAYQRYMAICARGNARRAGLQ